MHTNHLNNAHPSILVWSLLLTALLSLWSVPMQGYAQTEQSLSARINIQGLRHGVLVFGIPDHQSKIDFLQHTLSDGQISKNQHRRMERMLHQTIMERDSFATALTKALDNNYTFSDYIIANASQMEALKDSLIESWTGRGDSSNVYLVRRSVTESGADALIISDRSGKPLNRPFPYYVRITRFSAFFDALLGMPVVTWKNMDTVIAKLDKKLHAFYTRSIADIDVN